MDARTVGEVLLSCLGTRTDKPGAGAALRNLGTSDWEDILQQSVRHGVAPLLYHRLTAVRSGISIPLSIMQRLQEMYRASAMRNMVLYHELANVLGQLQDANIPVIVLKGAHLAELVYGDIALRPMRDLDLLVSIHDLPDVAEHLRRLGYAQVFSTEEMSEKNERLLEFTTPSGVTLEVHWTLDYLTSPVNSVTLDLDGIWRRACPTTIAGVKALVLCPEDLLLHLCVHTSLHHRFALGLLAFCDISQTIWRYRDELDWEQIVRRACDWGASGWVSLTLLLVKEGLETAVPDEALHALAPSAFEGCLPACTKALLVTNAWALSPNVAQLRGPKRLQDRARYFLRRAFPPRKVLAQLYAVSPASADLYLYYLVRLKDLLLRHGRAGWRLLRSDDDALAVAKILAALWR